MKKSFVLIVLLLGAALQVPAFRSDTLSVYSTKMSRYIPAIVISPDCSAWKACPAVYLLHGHGGNYMSWTHIRKDIGEQADAKGCFFICPDAENSWYWDSPANPGSQFETFVSRELPEYIDSHYSTLADKRFRAIMGLSMGGHGAIYLAFRHPDVFGACGSTSGGLDIRPFPLSWNMSDQLGPMEQNMEVWNRHSAINQIPLIHNGELSIIIDCGDDDFFLEVNKEFHSRLLGAGIDHDFITRPGVHWVDYWNNSFDYQLLFFCKFFERGRSEVKE